MLNITRLPEPPSLIAYRQQPQAEYDGPQFTPVKKDIRTRLLISQGYLCAYCMKRITDDQLQTKVEHWKCQDNYSEAQLDYTNMFVVCLGSTQGEEHCDSSKKNKDLTINPASSIKKVESFIKYTRIGEIYVDDDNEISKDLNVILNLNFDRLKRNRMAVYDAIKTKLSQKKGAATKKELEDLLEKYSQPKLNGQKIQYCGIAIYFLKKRLSRM
ncbi:retron system putative HNH endonuclease [Acinetobacter seifertii]|uniref:retron system putative HNH endonuclease n=1 Tax=Acinetobacter seifertii TaxID=1530123 RepID=UPI001F055AA6|nr:retron system putative HNH endonuclease [Acinetobacter seifertii]MCH2003783.1 TIGR02646 family protein [Acinetobacter seifertii]